MEPSLITLPQEVLEVIYAYLHGNDLHAISDTCQTLRQSVGIFALSNKRKMQVLFQKNEIYNLISRKQMRLYFTIFHTKDVKKLELARKVYYVFWEASPLARGHAAELHYIIMANNAWRFLCKSCGIILPLLDKSAIEGYLELTDIGPFQSLMGGYLSTRTLMQCAIQDDIYRVKALEHKAVVAGRHDVAIECRKIIRDCEQKEKARAYLIWMGVFCLCVLFTIALIFLSV